LDDHAVGTAIAVRSLRWGPPPPVPTACLGHRHALCADGCSYADGLQTCADACLARRPCAYGFRCCADGPLDWLP
jgi:hypothetical protein